VTEESQSACAKPREQRGKPKKERGKTGRGRLMGVMQTGGIGRGVHWLLRRLKKVRRAKTRSETKSRGGEGIVAVREKRGAKDQVHGHSGKGSSWDARDLEKRSTVG